MATNSMSGGALLPIVMTDSAAEADEKQLKASAISKASAYAAISYMTCAVLLVMFNKAALSSYNFPCANVITLCQMASSCCFLYALRRLKLISFSASESGGLTDNLVSMKTLISTLPLSLTYLFYMVIQFPALARTQ